jgi:methionyl-tRNA synthetase
MGFMTNYKFISSTLPYSNSSPHIGHAFEFVLTDVIARFYRVQGYNVFFNVGVDEHGIKVQQAAEKEGIPPQEYCDKLSLIWYNFCEKFHIDYNNFYRTSNYLHKILTKDLFERYFLNKPFTFKKKYKGKYCVGCETFITEKEQSLGNICPIHLTELIDLEEENFFLSLSYFRKQDWLLKDPLISITLSNELENLKKDFNEISITRKGVEWGVKINDETVLYVWFEALINYPLAAGFCTDSTDIWKKYWENSLIVCGKDNLKFQAYILPCICEALKISQPKEVLVHGLINDKNGIKMSKTIGNVIDPIEQLNKFGRAPVRFYLFCGLNIFGDSCYSEEELVNLWNAQIVNGYGNLLARILHLIDIREIEIDEKYSGYSAGIEAALDQNFEEYNFNGFKKNLFEFINTCNKRINDEKPYSKECENYIQILNELYFGLKVISKYIQIILPEFAEQIDDALEDKKKVVLFKKIEHENNLSI